ncbi:hypothetical protein O3G_MSEX002871 [Manduca sexta]|uniref:Serpin domain-containing protein n=1 Tax=Manduca sexta TaxID=7130 RepID=A0A922CE02_MANSE|nr:hypothetical protein O3G_MSEX002871 [Manduca sexta]
MIARDTSAQSLLNSLTSGALGLINNDQPDDPCSIDYSDLFANAITDFTNRILEIVVDYEQHFVISPYSMWMALAAVAEGADGTGKDELYEVLGLPSESCVREAFYRTALSLEIPDPGVQFTGKRLLIIDQHSYVIPDWERSVHETGLLDFDFDKLHPDSSEERDRPPFFRTPDIEGNSFLLDELNFVGLWTTGFAPATTFTNFYDENGQIVGPVELMTMTKQVRLAQLPLVDAKVLELPVGVAGRYTMLIAMGVNSIPIKELMSLFQSSVILKVLNELTLNLLPINIAIPRLIVQSDFKAKSMLQAVGVKSIWYEPDATRYITDPPALPEDLSQEISITLDTTGLNPPPADTQGNLLTGLLHAATSLTAKTASLVGREFIANKPFTYCLLDAKTKTIIFAGVFSDPDPK